MKLSFLTIFWGGGLACEHLWQETFGAGAVFRSSALCLFFVVLFVCCCFVLLFFGGGGDYYPSPRDPWDVAHLLLDRSLIIKIRGTAKLPNRENNVSAEISCFTV